MSAPNWVDLFGADPDFPETDEVLSRRAIDALVSALERTERNLRLAVENKPVRDMDENLAENAAAMRVAEAAR